MDTTTEAVKWKKIAIEEHQLSRAKKTRVCRLDYYAGGERKIHPCDDTDGLHALFDDGAETDGQEEGARLRLFVVEDLSREVIEKFGSKFDVDPSFFRSHLMDYVWCNIRDFWRDPPNLYLAAQQQSWFQLRFVIPRYFTTPDSFEAGTSEAEAFNVFRRLDDDQNRSRWDEEAIVGIMRTRVSFWLRPVDEKQAENPHRTDIGILLLDPTIEQGLPLWRHYRNWKTPPPMKGGEGYNEENFENRKTFFDDFIHWAKAPQVFDGRKGPSPSPNGDSLSPEKQRWANAGLPLQSLLHRICSEWLTMADYVKTRLNQVELEVSSPEHFLANGTQIDSVLTKLHTWRRSVPVYREMLEETLETVFGISSRLSMLLGGSLDASDPKWNPGRGTTCLCVGRPGNLTGDVEGVSAYRYDFALALAHMEEHQKRIDRLASIVTAAINIEDARRGYTANRNVNRLTLLATLFVPLSLVASLLSMQPGVEQLRNTAVLWAEIAIPLAFGVWLIANTLNSAWFQLRTQPLRDRLKGGPCSSRRG
ncbi:putative Mg2+ transporter zinc transport protein [Hirsutella rhossiliensis]|uniref:Mg2+ transporter zinc transport protein n=1 Tax=Hirsutella rhossiliensis TaxID=111463 RepID=A0A9P8SM77_9HYPO|nr:putative mg2+ transporter zinc transport protein [Hirsutella rhossiliensis]KAH0965886.1 putative mg2+ transporter zinc transport protein [Hirsutella rhossiliensis]